MSEKAQRMTNIAYPVFAVAILQYLRCSQNQTDTETKGQNKTQKLLIKLKEGMRHTTFIFGLRGGQNQGLMHVLLLQHI